MIYFQWISKKDWELLKFDILRIFLDWINIVCVDNHNHNYFHKDNRQNMLHRLDHKLDLDFHQDNYRDVDPMHLDEQFSQIFNEEMIQIWLLEKRKIFFSSKTTPKGRFNSLKVSKTYCLILLEYFVESTNLIDILVEDLGKHYCKTTFGKHEYITNENIRIDICFVNWNYLYEGEDFFSQSDWWWRRRKKQRIYHVDTIDVIKNSHLIVR